METTETDSTITIVTHTQIYGSDIATLMEGEETSYRCTTENVFYKRRQDAEEHTNMVGTQWTKDACARKVNALTIIFTSHRPNSYNAPTRHK